MASKTDETLKYPQVPKYVSENPAASAALSKLTADNEKTGNRHIGLPNVESIAGSVQRKISNNEDIVQLFPDTELCIQILTSSILSPNDMLTPSIIYTAPEIKLPSGLNASIIEMIRKHIKKNYNLENRLPTILREALFTKGAYIEAIIPEASLDDVINGEVKGLSLESYADEVSKNTTEIPDYINISNESYDIATCNVVTSDINKDKTFSLEELNISFTTNYKMLLAPDGYLNELKKAHFSNSHLSTEAIESDLNNLFKPTVTTKLEEVTQINTISDASRESIGRPLVYKLPVESVIPVHVANDVTKHIAYFVLLDNKGTPVNIDSELNSMDKLNNVNGTGATDMKTKLINKAKIALNGIVDKDPVIENIETIYSGIVENAIKNKLRNGLYSELVDIKENSDLYRVMFNRTLQNKKSRLLLLPAELVSFYAFDYRPNGTGKSLIEKVSTLYSMRSILLFTKLMAAIKNSVTTTVVSATLEETDMNPEATMYKIISETMKTRQTLLPIGISRIEDLAFWAHNIGFAYNIKHPGLPNMDISTTDANTNKVVPDNTLDESIQEQIIMSFGLTMEMVKAGYSEDFATSVVAKNLLLAKRVSQTQFIFNPLLTSNIRKLLVNDMDIYNKLKDLITVNLPAIKKLIKKNDGISEDADIEKIKDEDLVKFIIKTYLTGIGAELPSPEVNEESGMKTAFDNYKNMLNDYLDLIISSEALPSEVVGELSGKIDSIKAIMKNTLLRKWMADNNYLTEISEFLTVDDEGRPVFDILEDHNGFIKNFTDILLPFFKENSKMISKLDEKLSKVTSTDTAEDNTGEGNIDEPPTDEFTDDYQAPADEEGGDEVPPGDELPPEEDNTETPTEEETPPEEEPKPEEETPPTE